jgi:flagellar biosynthesis/type III secretory pathway chaperone
MDAAMDALLDVSSKKQEMLVSGDVAGLEKVVSAEQDLVAKLELLESDRSSAGEPPDEKAAGQVIGLRKSLREKAKKITDTNERNRGLLRQGLEVVQYELRLLLPQAGYGNPAARGPLVFDHRI